MRVAPLWTVADCRPSNVDKKSVDGQQAVRLCNYTDVYNNKFIDADMDLMEGTAPPDQIERFQVRPGDVLMTKDSESNEDIGIPSLVRTVEPGMVCGYHLTLLRPDTKTLDPSYLYWWLESKETKDFWYTNSFGVTRFSLVSPSVWRLPVRLPDLVEQRRISAFLDWETAEIDAMDAELDRLVETLRERREAVFDTALAGQTRFVSLAWATDDISTGPFGTQVKQGDYQVGGTPLINPSHIRGGQVVPDERVGVGVEKATELARHAMAEGDVVVARRGDLGRCAVIGRAEAGFLCGTGSLRVIPKPRLLDSRYAALVVSSRGSRAQMLAHSVGATMDNLNEDLLGRVRIPLPPLREQRLIVAESDERTARIDEMIADAHRLKALLAERRSTLITEVVTGVKEVLA